VSEVGFHTAAMHCNKWFNWFIIYSSCQSVWNLCKKCLRCYSIISMVYKVTVSKECMGWDSIGDIVTHYGLDGLGIEFWWRWIFSTCPDRPWGPPNLLYSG